MLEIEIDGKKAEVTEGSTVIEAAQQLGVYIPHFCYHKKLSIAANCRMCLVQVEKAPKPLPACATPVTAGMKVFTHSDLAIKAQKGVMEFLLINHPLDCPICDQGGECQLQDLAVGYGGVQSRYQEAKHVTFHKKVGPLISMEEMSRCIHCTRCVRFGQEVAGIMELGMGNRSVHSEIQTFVGRSVDSELSGNMIDLCPVGALTSKPFRYAARSWELQRRKSVSPHDGVGANLVIQVKGDRVMRVLPLENEAVNECWISDKDRFSYEALNSADRLTKPMVKQDGQWHEVEWNVALDYVSHALRDVVKNSGPDAVGALATPHATVEELYLLQKLVRGLGSGNVDYRLRQRDFSLDGKRKGAPWLGMRLEEIGSLASALLVGSFVRKEQPLVAARLRLAAKKGAQVSFLSVGGDDPLMVTHVQNVVAPDVLASELAAVLKAALCKKSLPVPPELEGVSISDAAVKMADSLVDAGAEGAVFLGNVAQHHPQSAQIFGLATRLVAVTGGRLAVLGEAANSVGGAVVGALPSGLNAYEMLAQPRQAYVLLHAEPEADFHNAQLTAGALNQAKSVIVLSSFKNEAALAYADVMLPVAPFTETAGSFVNMEGRVQAFNGVVRPLGETRPAWKVLRVLGNLLKIGGFDYESAEQVRADALLTGEFVTGKLDNALQADLPIILAAPGGEGLQRVGDVPIHSADALARRSPALQATRDAAVPTARMAAATANSLGVAAGDAVQVKQGQGACVLQVQIDDTVPAACVRVSAGHPMTSALGDLFGRVAVERA